MYRNHRNSCGIIEIRRVEVVLHLKQSHKLLLLPSHGADDRRSVLYVSECYLSSLIFLLLKKNDNM